MNTPMKIVNPDYQELDTVPIDIELRDRVGISVAQEEIGREIVPAVERLLGDEQFAPASMQKLKE